MRSAALLCLVGALSVDPACAQTNFPITMPANTVYGAVNQTGPGVAIPFDVLSGLLTVNSGGLVNNMPAFTYLCNNTNQNGVPAQACSPYSVNPPLFLNTSTNTLQLTTSWPNLDTYVGVGAGSHAPTISGSGGNNTGVGAFALLNVNGGSGNSAFGNGALLNLTTGVNNTGIGISAGAAMTTGTGNMAIGTSALASVTTGQNNVGIGLNALINATASNNTAIGEQALSSLTSGSANTAIGPGAGGGITTGGNDTIIGGCAGLSAALANAIGLCDGAGTLRFDWGITTASTMTLAGPVKSTTGFIATAVAPTVAAAQIGYGSTTVAAGSGTCPSGTVGGQTVAGCIVVNIAGTAKNVPYF